MKMLHFTKLGLVNISADTQVGLGPCWGPLENTILLMSPILKFMQNFISLQIVHVGFNIEIFYS